MTWHYSNQYIVSFTLFNTEQPLRGQWMNIPLSKGPKA